MSGRQTTSLADRSLRAVIEITRQIGAGRDLGMIFDTVADELIELMPYDRCSISLVEPGGETQRIIALRGRQSDAFRDGVAPVSGTILEWSLGERRPLIHDVGPEDRFVEDAARRDVGIAQVALAPIFVDDAPIGVIALSSITPGAYTGDRLWLLQTIGDHLGLAIAATNLRGDAERRAAKAQFLAETGRIFATTLDLDQTLRQAVDRAGLVLGELNLAYLIDEETGELRFRTLAHPDAAVADAVADFAYANPPTADDPLTGPALRGEAFLVPFITPDAIAPKARTLVARLGLNSVLAVPLRIPGRNLGVLISACMGNPAEPTVQRTLNADDLALAQDLAVQIATAIDKAWMHASTQRALDESEALRRIGQELTSTIELEPTLNLVASFARLLLGADYASVAGEGADGTFAWRAMIGNRTDTHRTMGQTVGSGPVAQAMATRQSIFQDRLPAATSPDDPEAEIHRAEGARAVLCVPLIVGERVSGALVLGYRAAHTVSRADNRMAAALAAQAALVLENARLFDSAQRALTARDDFLRIAAHELRTPLTTLSGRMQLLQRRLPAAAPKQDVESIAVMRRQLDRLSRMVNDLLDLSRLTAGRLLPQPERVDLAALGRIAAEEFSTAQHPIVFEGAVGELIGFWDPWQLDQVLANLLSNAIRFSAPGSPITLRTSRDGAVAHLEVQDNGSGIPVDELERIFERFYRGEQQDRAGFGLGLAICRQIITDHGGTLVGHSAGPNTGATFTIRLPIGLDQGMTLPSGTGLG